MSDCHRQKIDCDANFYLTQEYYALREWLEDKLPEGQELLKEFDARDKPSEVSDGHT